MTSPASRAFAKLEHALATFGVDLQGLVCADFGCNVGGFTDCLLRRGARRVFAVDTAYGVLAWRLRTDPRVVVMERTNALHAPPPEEGVDLLVVDLGWTPQRHALPAASRWLARDRPGRVITLIKPHYEAAAIGGAVVRGGLSADQALAARDRVLGELPGLGFELQGIVESPVHGAKSSRRGPGNVEFLALLRPLGTGSPGDPPGDLGAGWRAASDSRP